MTEVNHKRRAEIGQIKRERTRVLLLDSALICFAERDIGAVTTDEICKVASVSRGTFYNYFENMDQLVISVIKRLRNVIKGDFHEQNLKLFPGPIRMAFDLHLMFLQASISPDLAKMLLFATNNQHSSKFEDIFTSRLMEDVRACRSSGLFTVNDDILTIDIALGTGWRGLRSVAFGNASPDQSVSYLESIFVALGMPSEQAMKFSIYPQSFETIIHGE